MRRTLRDGQWIELRALTPDDGPLLEASFRRLSDRSRYRRFFVRMRELPAALLRALVDVDHHDREAILAIDPRTGQVIGVARYTRPEPDSEAAEIAVVVVDDWQGRGVGSILLARLTHRARQEGVRRFTAEVMAENREALRFFAGLGMRTERFQPGVIELELDVPARRGVGTRLAQSLRAAASGAVTPTRTLADQLALALRPVGGTPVAADEPIRALVVGVSARRRFALAAALRLARPLSATVHVVSRASESEARALVEREQTAAGTRDVEVVFHHRTGDLAAGLVSVVREVQADLVVVSGGRLERGAPLPRRSLANRVSHHAPCSVLIVRRPPARRRAAERDVGG